MDLAQLTREELIALLNESLARLDSDRSSQQVAMDEQLRRVHELRVYQIELEMQNLELRETQVELEASRDRERALHQRFAALDQLNVAVSTLLTTAERASPEAVIGAVTQSALSLLSPREASIRVEAAYGNGHALQVTRISPDAGRRDGTVELRAPMYLGAQAQGELVARFAEADVAEDLPRTMEMVAERVGLALEIARLNQQEARERARLRVFEQVNRAFASCHDRASTHLALIAAAEASVPSLARCCVPLVVEGDRFRQLGVAHPDARVRRLIGKLARRFEAWLQAGEGRAAELRTALEPVAFDRLEEAWLARLAELVELDSLVVVPMVVGGRLLGCLCFGHDEPVRALGRHLESSLVELAATCAAALERSRLIEELRAAVESRDTLLAIVSHDLRSPLNAIAITARTLGLPPTGSDRRQSAAQVALIQRTVASMRRLVDDLLLASTIDAGYFSLQPSPEQPAQLLDDAIALSEPAMRAKGLVCRRRCDDELPLVLADRERLLQVFTNLLSNAVKFSARGGQLFVSARQSGTSIEFCVADEGPGIAADALTKVFGRHWTGRGRRSELGLGLYISQCIVVAHGGRIWAESRPGNGASIRLTLPVMEAMSHDHTRVALAPLAAR